MWDLHDTFRSSLASDDHESIRWVFAAKLCARTGPLLFPVRDELVCRWLGGGHPRNGDGKPGDFSIDIQAYAYLMLTPRCATISLGSVQRPPECASTGKIYDPRRRSLAACEGRTFVARSQVSAFLFGALSLFPAMGEEDLPAESAAAAEKQMKLRYAGTCRVCGRELPAEPRRSRRARPRRCDVSTENTSPPLLSIRGPRRRKSPALSRRRSPTPRVAPRTPPRPGWRVHPLDVVRASQSEARGTDPVSAPEDRRIPPGGHR